MRPELEGVVVWKGNGRERSGGLALERRLAGGQQLVPLSELLETPETRIERQSAHLHERRRLGRSSCLVTERRRGRGYCLQVRYADILYIMNALLHTVSLYAVYSNIELPNMNFII